MNSVLWQRLTLQKYQREGLGCRTHSACTIALSLSLSRSALSRGFARRTSFTSRPHADVHSSRILKSKELVQVDIHPVPKIRARTVHAQRCLRVAVSLRCARYPRRK